MAWCYSKCLGDYENSNFVKIFVRSFGQLTWEYEEVFSKWTVLPVGCVSFWLLSVNPENWFSLEQLGEILYFESKSFQSYWLFLNVFCCCIIFLFCFWDWCLNGCCDDVLSLCGLLPLGIAGCVHVLKRMGLLALLQNKTFLVLHTYMTSVTCMLAGLCLFYLSNSKVVCILLGAKLRFWVLYRSLLCLMSFRV